MSKVNRRKAIAAAAEPDPVFAVIETHRKACIAWNKLDAAAEEDGRGEIASEAENAAFEDLFTTKPTTLAGLAAVMSYMATREDRDQDLSLHITHRRGSETTKVAVLLHALSKAVRAMEKRP